MMRIAPMMALIGLLASPAFAETAAPAAAPYDPFVMRHVEPDDMLPELSCIPRPAFEAAVKAHNGSKLVTMTPSQAMFWRGVYATLPMTADKYPVGEGVVYTLRSLDKPGQEHEAPGVVAFTLGENLICNPIPVTQRALQMLLRANGAGSPT